MTHWAGLGMKALTGNHFKNCSRNARPEVPRKMHRKVPREESRKVPREVLRKVPRRASGEGAPERFWRMLLANNSPKRFCRHSHLVQDLFDKSPGACSGAYSGALSGARSGGPKSLPGHAPGHLPAAPSPEIFARIFNLVVSTRT
jgi:hypothetical protein